jgi:hypothetical protein
LEPKAAGFPLEMESFSCRLDQFTVFAAFCNIIRFSIDEPRGDTAARDSGMNTFGTVRRYHDHPETLVS